MKKLLLSYILFSVTFVSVAQQEIKNHLQKATPTLVTSTETAIGNTTHDLQSYSSVRNQLYYYPNGTVGCVWNFDNIPTPLPQTAYNYYNGTIWNAIPSAPNLIAGFAGINRLSNGTEVIVSYDSSTAGGLRLDTCNVPGTNCWAGTLLPPEPNGHQSGWAHSAVGGANGMSIHVVSLTEPVSFGGFPYNGVDGMLTYSRSEDGGTTWNIIHATLPGWNSTFTKCMIPDHYTIDARGSTVAITAGGKTNDWVMWKSVDNGTTFTKTTIQSFPISAYDELTMITDTNSNGIADTIWDRDGALEVLIDNIGIVHCWSGAAFMCDTSISGVMHIINYPWGGANGALYYWNEGIGSGQPMVIAMPEDIDGDGAYTFENNFAKYGTGTCSMPTAGMDQNGKIYLCFSCLAEGTSSGTVTPQSYRDIYITMTSDYGTSWTWPANLTQTFFEEEVYPSLARNVDSLVRVIYMRDVEPGLAAWGDLDPIGINDIICFNADTAAIISGYIKYGISGSVFYDANNNSLYDAGDNYVNSNSLFIKNTTVNSYTAIYPGNYWQSFFNGVHKLYVSPLPYYITSVPDTATVTVTGANVLNVNFALQATTSHDSANAHNHIWFSMCNQVADHQLEIENVGTSSKSFVVKFHVDPAIVSVSNYVPVPDSIVGNDYYWTTASLQPFTHAEIYIDLLLPGPGIPITLYTDVYDAGTLTWMNSDTLSYTVSCAWDPNDKTAEPIGVSSPHYTLKNNFIEYLIRFQNTGNDTAFNVMILDTLDASFNFSTFQILNASHFMGLEVHPGNILRYRFNNILLPDSNVNEPASHGFIRYRIKPLSSAPVNTVVFNTAHIYFDFNLPVATNTTFNTLVNVIPSGINENAFAGNNIMVIPNPFNESVKIVFENKTHDKVTIHISDLAGRTIYISETIAEEFLWYARNVEDGIYLLSINKSLTGKIASALMVKQ